VRLCLLLCCWFNTPLAWGGDSLAEAGDATSSARSEGADHSSDAASVWQLTDVFVDAQLSQYEFPNSVYTAVPTLAARIGVVTANDWRATLFAGYTRAVPAIGLENGPDPTLTFGASIGRVVWRTSSLLVAPSLLAMRTDTDVGTNLLLVLPFDSTGPDGTRVGFEMGMGANFFATKYNCAYNDVCERDGGRAPELSLLFGFHIGGGWAPSDRSERRTEPRDSEPAGSRGAQVSDHSWSAPVRLALQLKARRLFARYRWSGVAGGVHLTTILPLGFRASLGLDRVRINQVDGYLVRQDIDWAFSTAFGFDVVSSPAFTVAPALAFTTTGHYLDAYFVTLRLPIQYVTESGLMFGVEAEYGYAYGGRRWDYRRGGPQSTRPRENATATGLTGGYVW
jgi:hypothetical protein